MNRNLQLVWNGFLPENPIFRLALSLCPAVAVTTSIKNGLLLGVAVLFVQVFSSCTVAIFRSLIHPRIRIPGTYNALCALRREHILSNDACGMLQQAYLFMRKLESRMRIVSNQATSELSKKPEALQPLARRMGYADDGTPAGRKLLHEYEQLSMRVRRLFEQTVSGSGETAASPGF